MLSTSNNTLFRTTLTVLLLCGLLALLYVGRGFLMPLVMGGLLAMVLDPLSQKLQGRGWPRWLAIAVCMLLIFAILGGLTWLISWQAGEIAKDWPKIQDRLLDQLREVQRWLNRRFGITYAEDIGPQLKKGTSQLPQVVQVVFGGLTGGLANFFLVLGYIALCLIERDRFKNALIRLAPAGERTEARKTVEEAAQVTSQYLSGIAKDVSLLGLFYAIGFSIGGVPYGIFLAVFSALFSIIPYLGNILGGGVAMVLAFVTNGPESALLVLGIMAAGQMIENYIFQPLIVGDSIRLNPFVTIASVLFFGTLWGTFGAILALPLTGMLRVIFSRLEGTKGLGYFLSNDPVDGSRPPRQVPGFFQKVMGWFGGKEQ